MEGAHSRGSSDRIDRCSGAPIVRCVQVDASGTSCVSAVERGFWCFASLRTQWSGTERIRHFCVLDPEHFLRIDCVTVRSSAGGVQRGCLPPAGDVRLVKLARKFGALNRSLDISNNVFSGTFPTVLTSLTTLTSLMLCCNSFTGSIPSSISALVSLAYLDVSDQPGSSLSGSLPSTFWSLTSLR